MISIWYRPTFVKIRRHNLNFVCALIDGNSTGPTMRRSLHVVVQAKPVSIVLMPACANRLYSQTVAKCWNCQEALSSDLCIQYLCVSCHSLLRIPKECNYFQLLGLEKKFHINLIELQRRFRAVQSILHPDKYSNKSKEEQALSADWSSLINNAYKTLHSPIRRGEYLLQLHGVTVSESNSELNKEFLMEMMERNEEVDDADNAKELTDLLQKVRADMIKCAEKLGKSLDEQKLDEAKADLIIFRYFVSLENSIKEKSNRLGIHL